MHGAPSGFDPGQCRKQMAPRPVEGEILQRPVPIRQRRAGRRGPGSGSQHHAVQGQKIGDGAGQRAGLGQNAADFGAPGPGRVAVAAMLAGIAIAARRAAPGIVDVDRRPQAMGESRPGPRYGGLLPPLPHGVGGCLRKMELNGLAGPLAAGGFGRGAGGGMAHEGRYRN